MSRIAHLWFSIERHWNAGRAFALQPHRVETFKLSKDPLFIEKVRDIVGLYLQPPDKALVRHERGPQAHRLDQDGRRNPRQRRALLSANL